MNLPDKHVYRAVRRSAEVADRRLSVLKAVAKRKARPVSQSQYEHALEIVFSYIYGDKKDIIGLIIPPVDKSRGP